MYTFSAIRLARRSRKATKRKAPKKETKSGSSISVPKDSMEYRTKNKIRRALLLLGQLNAGLQGKSIISLLISRGALSESMASALSGLPILNGRAIISALSRSGVIHVIGEKQLQMKHKRRYIEMIYSVDPVAAGRAFRDMLSNILSLLMSIEKALETDQLLYFCENDYALFSESEVERLEYRCPICGEPLTPIMVNMSALHEFIEKIKSEFKRIVF